MLYFYLFLLFGFLAVITVCFLHSLKFSGIPPNAEIIVAAWSATTRHQISREDVSNGAACQLPFSVVS